MESERQRKRQRLPLPTKKRRVEPDVVDLSSGPDEPVVAKIPSRKDIAKMLQKIEVSTSWKESLQAIQQIQNWLMDPPVRRYKSCAEMALDNVVVTTLVLDSFYCYGGMARILEFMSEYNKNWDCVVGVTSFIADMLSFRWGEKEKDRKIANELAKMFFRCGGIDKCTFVVAFHQEFKSNPNPITADTKYVWMTMGRALNGEEAREMVSEEADRFLVLQQARICISGLVEDKHGSNDSAAWACDVLEAALYSIANIIKYTSVTKDMLEELDIARYCIQVLAENDWIQNENVATYALGVLFLCIQHKEVEIELFEHLMSPLIYCMKHFSANVPVRSFVLILLESACEKLPREQIESSGVLEAISALLKSEHSCKKTKDKVRDIMRKIIK